MGTNEKPSFISINNILETLTKTHTHTQLHTYIYIHTYIQALYTHACMHIQSIKRLEMHIYQQSLSCRKSRDAAGASVARGDGRPAARLG